MQEHKKNGHCVKCSHFKKEQLSAEAEAHFKTIWGSGSADIAEVKCSVHVDDFYETCPKENDTN